VGLGDTTRGEKLLGHIAPPAEAQEEQPSSRECRQTKEGTWQLKEDPVGYSGKQSWERKDNITPLV